MKFGQWITKEERVMSYKLKRAVSLMIAVLVAFGMMTFGTGEANAASGKVKVIVKSQDLDNTIYVREEGCVCAYNPKKDDFAIVKAVKITDKSIARVKRTTYKYKGKKYKEYYVVGKKSGKTKLSVKYKYKGKTSTKKLTVTVKEYPNAIQSITINGKNVPLTGEKAFRYEKKYSKKKTKVNVKVVPAKGWKIIDTNGELYTVTGKSVKKTGIKKAITKVKKGSDISYSKEYKNCWLNVQMTNENGDMFSYEIDLYR